MLRPSWAGMTTPIVGESNETNMGARPSLDRGSEWTILRGPKLAAFIPSEVDPPLTHSQSWYRTRVALVSAAAVSAIAIVGGMVASTRGSGTHVLAATLTRPTEEVYASAPAVSDNGLVASRTWRLSDARDRRLSARLVATNAATTVVTAEVIEGIPKTLAKDVSDIAFVQTPRVVNPDPVVAFKVDALAPGQQATFEYSIVTSTSDQTPKQRLEQRGTERDALMRTLIKETTLQSISVSPTRFTSTRAPPHRR